MSTRKELATMFRLNWARTGYLGLVCFWTYIIASTLTFLS
jgi:hypothetical protein